MATKAINYRIKGKDGSIRTVSIQVSNTGKVYTIDGEELQQHTFNNHGKYLYAYYYQDGRMEQINVARAVCQAFHPIPNPEDYQTDHIDNDSMNNISSNLRWLDRKSNNSRRHAIKMRIQNHKLTTHPNHYVKAVKGDQVVYYRNGRDAAIGIGCSSPMAYKALDGLTKAARGWTLTYIEKDADECAAYREQLAREKQAKVEMKAQKRKQVNSRAKLRRQKVRQLMADLRRSWSSTITRNLAQATIELSQAKHDYNAVQCCDLEGNVLGEYENIHQAEQTTGITTIRDAMYSSPNLEGVAGGKVWKYKVNLEG